MHDMARLLAEHKFLEGMKPAYVEKMAACARAESYPAGTRLFRAGETATACYLLREGHVAIEIYDASRGPITVQTIGEPSVLGWSWLIPPYKWCFDAHVVEMTRAIVLDADTLRALCEENHDFGYDLLKRFTRVFADRLDAARFQLLDVYKDVQ